MSDFPEIRKLIEFPEPRKPGRPKKIELPELPAEIMQSMSQIERVHFAFLIQAVKTEHPDLLPSDQLYLNMAALNYVATLRTKEAEMRGVPFSAHKVSPEIMMLRWLDALSISRKQRNPGKTDREAESEFWREAFTQANQ